MSMLKDFAQWIKEQTQTTTFVIDGQTYSREPLHLVEGRETLPQPVQPFETSSLSSIVEYIRARVDQQNYLHDVRYIIHIMNHRCVTLTTEAFRDHEQRVLRVAANAQIPQIPFDQYVSREQLNIMLQTMFVESDQRKLALEFIGRIAAESSIEEDDDGIGQMVTVKQGIARKGKEQTPAAFILAPFRTFSEAPQPTSPFILRLKSLEGIHAALFEADGGAWKIEAIKAIKDTLQSLLVEAKLGNDVEQQQIVILT